MTVCKCGKTHRKGISIAMLLLLAGFIVAAGPRQTAAADVSATEPVEKPGDRAPKAPGKIAEICLCSLGRDRVALTWEEVEGATQYQVYRRKKGSSTYRGVGAVTKGSFTDKGLSFGATYQYRVVPIARTAGGTSEGKATSVTYQNVKVVATNHQKYSYTEMKADIELLAKNYHGMVGYGVIGKTADGRNIYDVILGNPKAKKTFLVVSTLHAREYMASLVCMNQIEYYLQNYQKKLDGKRVKDTLDKIAIHYVPMANPDGVTLSQFGVGKIRSASLKRLIRKIGTGRTARWKANARGGRSEHELPRCFSGYAKTGQRRQPGPKRGQ